MASVAGVYEERRMSIGRVFQRAFSAISLNPGVILGLALVVGALPSLIMSYAFFRLGLGNAEAIRSGAITPMGFGVGMMLSGLATFVISELVQGALTRATVSANEGHRASFGASLAAAVRVLLPLIGLSFLWAFGVTIGFILLVVPGIILLMMWAVAVPALVVERRGVFAAFARSAELTKGARWKIFGLCLVLLVIYWLLSLIVGIIGLGTYQPSNPAGFTIANLIGSIVVGTIFNTLWGTIQPSLYVELRQWKEGDSADNLAEVFA
jgi:MFS family permease